MTTLWRLRILAAAALGLLLTSCGGLTRADEDTKLAALGLGPGPRATGDVEIVWPGGRGSGTPDGAEKLAFAELSWLDDYRNKSDRGSFRYLVVNADGTVHREIVAKVVPDDSRTGVSVADATAAFVGKVTYDSKAVAGGTDGSTGGEGGCEDDAAGGCSGDDGMGGGTHEEGGCSGDHEEGDQGGPKHPPGSESRVGQIVAAVAYDGGTPGTSGDRVTWSWFDEPTDLHPTYLPPLSITDHDDWPELCEKSIVGGNLVVHP